MTRNSPWLDEIPSVREIFDEVVNRTKWRDLPERIKADKGTISTAFAELEKECWDRYLEYEDKIKEKWRHKGLDVLEKSLSQPLSFLAQSLPGRRLSLGVSGIVSGDSACSKSA